MTWYSYRLCRRDGVHVAGADENRRGLTVLFWSNVTPYGTFRLDVDKRLDLVPVAAPRP